ncbi:MAG: hypothetical protein ACRYG7_46195 [Janthinobacterium lividum]
MAELQLTFCRTRPPRRFCAGAMPAVTHPSPGWPCWTAVFTMGPESLLLANERNGRHRQDPHLSSAQAALLAPSTLYLVADVSAPKKGIYSVPRPGPAAGRSPTLPRLGAYLLAAAMALLALAAALAGGDHPF